jgi:23S rRNA (cytidine2498-2'-O)-methyltransferase
VFSVVSIPFSNSFGCMSLPSAQFVFLTCRAGAESAVKNEVARSEPEWRPSFSRPGFLTIKHAGDRPIDTQRLAERSWTFAHAHGISLGRLAGTQLSELVGQFWEHPGVAALVESRHQLELHVWQREPIVAEEAELESFVTPLCDEIEAALRMNAPESAKIERTIGSRRKAVTRNSLVLDVVIVEPGEWWIGYHRAVRPVERWAGGVIPVRLPKHAVSRAYAKMEEALQWSGLPVVAGDELVEIGCAPGGASQALLERGLFVTGIDPADVDPSVLEHTRFRHLKKRGTDVRKHEFEGVRWLAADMNIAPESTLDEVEAIVRHPGVTIRGLVLTLKFADWTAADKLPEFISRVHEWGYRDVRTRQLVTGGQEVCLVALRRKALRRLGKKRGRKGALSRKRPDEGHSTIPKPHF